MPPRLPAAKMREMYATLGDYLAESSALLTAAAGAIGQPAVEAAVDAIVGVAESRR